MKIAIFAVVVMGLLGSQELDPGNMKRGDVGSLPATSRSYFYEVASVHDEDVLVVVMELRGKTIDAAGPRFFYRDAETARKYREIESKTKRDANLSLRLPIQFPGTYKVMGTKTVGGVPLPRIDKQ